MPHKEVDYTKQCEEGDEFYRIIKDTVVHVQITKITHQQLGHYTYEDSLKHVHFGRAFSGVLFKTEEDAYKELLKRQNIKEKRKLLKEYERELNMKFNLEDHYIIK